MGIHKKIKKIIKDHVKECRKSYSWDGEHETTIKKIINILKKKLK